MKKSLLLCVTLLCRSVLPQWSSFTCPHALQQFQVFSSKLPSLFNIHICRRSHHKPLPGHLLRYHCHRCLPCKHHHTLRCLKHCNIHNHDPAAPVRKILWTCHSSLFSTGFCNFDLHIFPCTVPWSYLFKIILQQCGSKSFKKTCHNTEKVIILTCFAVKSSYRVSNSTWLLLSDTLPSQIPDIVSIMRL